MPQRDDAFTENRFFHIIAVVLGTVFLGLLSYFAWTIQDSKILLSAMAEHIKSIDEKMEETSNWIGKRFDDHETRIRIIESKVKP